MLPRIGRTVKALIFAFIGMFAFEAMSQSVADRGRTVRSLGMGGVLIPFVDSADAIFYNPAALKRASLIDIRLLDLSVGTNSNTVDQLQTIQDINPDDPASFNSLYGQKIWIHANGRTAFSTPLFAFGYITDYEVQAELHNPAFPFFETYFRNDEAYYLGRSFEILPGTYFGLSFKRMNRWGGESQQLGVGDIADASTLTDIGSRFENRGQGTGIDIALLHEISTPLKPTFTLVWQDIGNTTFRRTSGESAPPSIESNLSAGAGVQLDLPGLDLAAGFEARQLLQTSIEIGKKVYGGVEVSLPMIDLRAGYSQGYLSYGFGVDLFILSLDAVAYKEEMGAYPGQSGDQRYMVSLNLDLSFDAQFNFTDNTGKKRKLKQRR